MGSSPIVSTDLILVTRNGCPSFVLVNTDDLKSLEETLDVLRDGALVESIRRSAQEAVEGERLCLRDQV